MSKKLGFVIILLLMVASSAFCPSTFAQVVLPSRANIERSSDSLIDLIRATQRQHVRESWGERASECFTDVNLATFKKENVTKKIVDQLRNDQNFLAIVHALRALNGQQRSELLERASATYKPTWAQLGKIDRLGQTDAGQQAEKEIAAAIVELVKEML